ncbi:site-specific integrase [Chitinophaga tropicalis]|uniref:Tyrosine-type recombinase/integrase n=1 Tax=Chitinophaga tropicalis TaxID=2683588 RepID=A0A7K1UAJ0_9BACT|nr:tyrosine-type recombinase/integrase [Chitinophaga tropicalis]MVT11394.1 tyrosine-type recombinase/integrase [Chitinophaga tropicalis]
MKNHLTNGCHYTEFNKFPKNWNTTRASMKLTWRIEYRFFDPAFKEKYPEGKRKVIKSGLNKEKDRERRQQMMRELITFERDLLENQGYNPILNEREKPDDSPTLSLIDPGTPFIQALKLGLEMKVMSEKTKKDIANKMPHVKRAAEAIKLNDQLLSDMPIGSIRRKHIRLLLDRIGRNKKENWTANNFNRYRTDLQIIFKELNELEAMEVNPIEGISKRKTVRKKRDVLSVKERILVNTHLRENYYSFWRFMQIFFHSGARESELLSVERRHVDLEKQIFKVLIKKGEFYREDDRPINVNALPLWQEVVKEADELSAGGPDERLYLFCEDLMPMWRNRPIRQEQISRRWKFHVKDKLGIEKDFYPLKHLNTTESVNSELQKALQDAQQKAAEQNGHTTTTMVRSIYDVNNAERELAIKKVAKNKFA